MSTYQMTGIIIRHHDLREVDRTITLYTEEYGKITVLARGTRKISSKLAGSLEPIQLVTVQCVRGARLDTVTDVTVQDAWRRLHAEPAALALARYIATLLDRLLHDRQRDRHLYALVLQALQRLDTSGITPAQLFLLRWFFVWQLVSAVGHQPEVNRCVICRQVLAPSAVVFSWKRGGVAHARCSSAIDVVPIGANTVKLLRELVHQPIERVMLLTMPSAVAQECERITTLFINAIAETDLSFRPFFESA
ncbi:MAG: DNA repair protein RecO [Patescibacteria group bacterium]